MLSQSSAIASTGFRIQRAHDDMLSRSTQFNQAETSVHFSIHTAHCAHWTNWLMQTSPSESNVIA